MHSLDSGYVLTCSFRKYAAILFFLSLVFVPITAVHSIPLSKSDVKDLLDKGGTDRQRGIWYIYQLRYHDLLRTAAEFLLTSKDPEDHRAVLNVFQAYGNSLENHLPDWYVFLDEFMSISTPRDILQECFRLSVAWQEQRMMAPLSRFAVHPSMSVRMSAFDSMASMGNDMLIPVLLRLLVSERPIYRIYGLEGAIRYYDSRLTPFVVKLLQDENKSVRIYAIEANGTKTELSGNIIRMYTLDKNEEVRERIVEAISKNAWRQHSYVLNKAVSDDSFLVRKAALEGIINLNIIYAAKEVSLQLSRESSEELRSFSLDVLMHLKNSGGGAGISSVLVNDPVEDLRLKAALAAGITSESILSDALIQAAGSDASYRVRLEAAHSMGLIKNSKFIDILEKITSREDENFDVRTQALISLMEIDPVNGLKLVREKKSQIKDPLFLKQVEAVIKRMSDQG